MFTAIVQIQTKFIMLLQLKHRNKKRKMNLNHNNISCNNTNPPQLTVSTQEKYKRDPKQYHYFQKIVENCDILYDDNYLYDILNDFNLPVNTNQQAPQHQAPPLRFAVNFIESMMPEQEIPIESPNEINEISSLVEQREKKRRNRTKLEQQDRHRLNRFPQYLADSIQTLNENINFNGVQLDIKDLPMFSLIFKYFHKLKQILISSKSWQRTRENQKILLNQVTLAQMQELQNSEIKLNPVQQKYLQILEQFNQKHIKAFNLAKQALKRVIRNNMSPQWMSDQAISKAYTTGFKGTEEEIREKIILFQKYLIYFKQQLGNKSLQFNVTWKHIKNLPIHQK